MLNDRETHPEIYVNHKAVNEHLMKSPNVSFERSFNMQTYKISIKLRRDKTCFLHMRK